MEEIPIKKVIVCVDGSQQSLKAARRALDVAKRYDAQIIALYISYLPLTIRQSPEYMATQLYKNDSEEASKWLDDISKDAKENNINFNIQVKETTTSIVKEIIKAAEESTTDLIVLGSTGRSKFERLLLGSVAQGVMTYAKCSVLVVR